MAARERGAGIAGGTDRSLRARAVILLQHALPQHGLSRLVRWLTRLPLGPLGRLAARAFGRAFDVDLSEAVQPELAAYATFNAFFTRALRPGARPFPDDPGIIASPVDGTVSQAGIARADRLLQAKGRDYSLAALLGGAPWASRFVDGSFATLYLAPRDYHRIHMPAAGTLRAARFVPGRLFSVNEASAAAIPDLFAVNERLACLFEGPAGEFALVMVGALLVGSIETVWHGEVPPGGGRLLADLPLAAGRAPLALPQGAELGRFNMGSTVILLLPPGRARWLPGVAPLAKVRCGMPLARLATPT